MDAAGGELQTGPVKQGAEVRHNFEDSKPRRPVLCTSKVAVQRNGHFRYKLFSEIGALATS